MLWRALLNGLGGAGALMLGLVVFPALQVGGYPSSRAEAPRRLDVLPPRARTMAAWALGAYATLIAACALAYGVAGMSGFDAVAHALATVSTGGFSTHDASIGSFRSAGVEWTAMLFMISGAVPFAVFFRAWRGDPVAPWRSHEIRAFAAICLAAAAVLAVAAVAAEHPGPAAVREALFAAVSTLTTTGFAGRTGPHRARFRKRCCSGCSSWGAAGARRQAG